MDFMWWKMGKKEMKKIKKYKNVLKYKYCCYCCFLMRYVWFINVFGIVLLIWVGWDLYI